MQCPSPKCQSSNVQLLSHYVDSLPSGSPHRTTYAQPAAADGSVLAAVGLAVLGMVALFSGQILAGLIAVAAAIVWGAAVHRRAEAAEAARTAWANKRICLACSEQWVP